MNITITPTDFEYLLLCTILPAQILDIPTTYINSKYIPRFFPKKDAIGKKGLRVTEERLKRIKGKLFKSELV